MLGLLQQRRWRMFAVEAVFDVLVLSYLFGMNLVVPFAQREFGVDRSYAAWVVIAFSLGTVVAILPAAFLGNTLGRKRILLVGLTMEVVGLVAVFFAPSLNLIIALQVWQGMGNALRFTSMMAIVQGAFPVEERGKSLGLIGAAHGLGALLATPVAGLIIDNIGWRYVFLLNVPVYLFAIIGVAAVYQDVGLRPDQTRVLRSFDYFGAVAVAVGMTALLLGLPELRQGGNSPLAAVGLAVALVALAAFVINERRSPNPLIDLSLFRVPMFRMGSGLVFFFAVFNAAVVLLFPFYLIDGLGWTAAYAGSVLITLNVGRPVLAPVSGRLADRFGSTPVLVAAIGVTVVGGVIAAALGSNPPVVAVVVALLLVGVGFGLFQTPTNRQIYVSVPQEKLSLAPGVTILGGHGGRAIGGTAGITLLTGIAVNTSIASAFAISMLTLTLLFAVGAATLLVLAGGTSPAATPDAKRTSA